MADIVYTTTKLPPAFLGVPYEAGIALTSSTIVTAHSISAGALPAGITLDAAVTSQRIAGTPTVTGTFTFTISATDTGGAVTKQYTLTVWGAPGDERLDGSLLTPAAAVAELGLA